jgi:hypothetical protein
MTSYTSMAFTEATLPLFEQGNLRETFIATPNA